MDTEIVVFQPPEQKEVTLTKSERELLYEAFERQSPLDPHHFRAFYDMETEDIASAPIKSTIASVLFERMLDINIAPIVSELPRLNLRVKKRLNSAEKTRVIIEESDKGEYYFAMQFPKRVRGYLITGEPLMISTGVPYRVVGMQMPKRLKITRDKTIPNFANAINILDLAAMGTYGLKDFMTRQYTQQRRHFPRYPNSRMQADMLGKRIIFASGENAAKDIGAVARLVESMKDYYETNLASLYTSMQYGPFAKYRTIMINQTIPPIYHEFDKLMTAMKLADTDETQKMRELFMGKLPLQSFRFLYALDNNGILDTYNKIRILGLGHVSSQDILAQIANSNSDKTMMQAQAKKKSDTYLEFAKKQAISLEKFGVSNLRDLTAEQKNIIDLSYKNLKKLELRMAGSVKLASELQANLDTMNIAGIQKNVSEIDSIADGSPDELLRDQDGVQFLCPHTLARAKKILSNSQYIRSDPGKLTQIREFIINTYARPEILIGYYCRICGALLAEQDDDNIVKFLPDQQMIPDIRQALIWKEVSYIVTTFVKFKDPVDVKKIVASITSSIQAEIGYIEAKLSKIRTTSADNTRDVMRIYITIYAYAVIIQMIYLNYGKITFSSRANKHGGRRFARRAKKSRTASPYVGGDMSDSGDDADDDGMSDSGDDTADSDSDDGMSDSGDADGRSDSDADIKDADGKDDSPFVRGGRREQVALQSEDKKRLQNIFKSALDLIIKSKNSLLDKLSNISVDNIKPLLIKAYQWVVSLKHAVSSSESSRDANTAYFLSIDPIYNYIWHAHSLKDFADEKGPADKADVKRYLGRSLTQIETDYLANKTIYETAVGVEPWGKTPKAEYDYASFMTVYNYVKNKTYLGTVIPMSEQLSNHERACEKVHVLEKVMKRAVVTQNLRPMTSYDATDAVFRANTFLRSAINISEYYCPDGSKHKFDIFIFSKILESGVLSDEHVELRGKDIVKWIDDANRSKLEDFAKLHIVDGKCSKCGSIASDTKKDANIEKKLMQISEYRAFYDYFEYRCPEGNLHDYSIITKKNTENCTKCGFTLSLVAQLDQTYYKKYLPRHKEIQSEQKSIDADSIRDFKNMSKEYKLAATNYPEWQINNSGILKLSRTMDIKYNILINLGFSEGRKYENIEKEKENPTISSTEDEDVLRTQYLRDYCLWVIRTYYTFKNYTDAVKVPAKLKDLIDAQRKINRDLTELKSALPELYNDFNKIYEHYSRRLPRKSLANFLLDYVCEFMNKIIEGLSNTTYAKIGREFVQYLLNTIIQSEKDVSQPPPLSLIIDHGDSGVPQSEEMAAEEYIDVSELDEDMDKSLDELDDAEVDDFARGDIDMGDDYDSDQFDINAADL
jgi:hypothetical protein